MRNGNEGRVIDGGLYMEALTASFVKAAATIYNPLSITHFFSGLRNYG